MKGLVGKWMVVAAVGVLGFGLGPRGASADIVSGNGKPASNCYAELDIDSTSGAVIDYAKKSTVYSCVDGSACDLDGACNGECKFHFGVCINVPGFEGCTPPGMLQKVKAKGNVTGVKGASGKVVIDTSQLLVGSVCGAYVDAFVPLKGKADKPKSGKAKVKLMAKAEKGTKPRKDSDKYDLVCEPAPGGCGSASGAFVD
jgi:hypothetical protein